MFWLRNKKNIFWYALSTEFLYRVIVYFCYVMNHWTIAGAIILDIDWDYTMAWFPA